MIDHQIGVFHSLSLGPIDFGRLVSEIAAYIERENNSHFKLVIGSDSEMVDKTSAHFVSAIVVHHVGHGGIYFWGGVTKSKIISLRQRIYEEAAYSLSLAQRLLESLEAKICRKRKFWKFMWILEKMVILGQ